MTQKQEIEDLRSEINTLKVKLMNDLSKLATGFKEDCESLRRTLQNVSDRKNPQEKMLFDTMNSVVRRVDALERDQPEKFTIAMSEGAYIETMKTIQTARGRDMETLITGAIECVKGFLEQQKEETARAPAQQATSVLGEKRDRVKETEQVIEMLKAAGQDPKDYGTLLSSIWRGF